jgi:hypothetical protein
MNHHRCHRRVDSPLRAGHGTPQDFKAQSAAPKVTLQEMRDRQQQAARQQAGFVPATAVATAAKCAAGLLLPVVAPSRDPVSSSLPASLHFQAERKQPRWGEEARLVEIDCASAHELPSALLPVPERHIGLRSPEQTKKCRCRGVPFLTAARGRRSCRRGRIRLRRRHCRRFHQRCRGRSRRSERSASMDRALAWWTRAVVK